MENNLFEDKKKSKADKFRRNVIKNVLTLGLLGFIGTMLALYFFKPTDNYEAFTFLCKGLAIYFAIYAAVIFVSSMICSIQARTLNDQEDNQ